MKWFLLVPTRLVDDFQKLDPTLVLDSDDLQDVCVALVKANQRRLAEKIADLVSATEETL